jgi:predicted ester cyclase
VFAFEKQPHTKANTVDSPPTGNKLSYSVAAISRVVEGKIVEGWIVYDQLDFLKQLGAIEYKDRLKAED